ncbi:unnamed protein product [Paramecium sonneborni]|uniref:Uncharacterized protein n=1 Tax=Paramecium sonneborni TaxID=65129 RepID=A0A8S1LEN2_9CILI|nr:unnamed protein product [Paramecium sonneborni]
MSKFNRYLYELLFKFTRICITQYWASLCNYQQIKFSNIC